MGKDSANQTAQKAQLVGSIAKSAMAIKRVHASMSVVKEKEETEDPSEEAEGSQDNQPGNLLTSGARVKLRNLQNKPELNGREGTCNRVLGNGRWEVRLDTGETFAF